MLYMQPMETLQTGVLGVNAARLVGLELRYDSGTAQIHHRSTMAKIARDLGTRHGHAT